ncbi:MAG: FAD binding domain-containing protein [Gammaproteobacteria bacterium]|jgi:4-hydroxybenzoyl-CoA reductase subunit beta|nr:FAD binding domain-containing protein [Gammaproteobacteria bacterium]
MQLPEFEYIRPKSLAEGLQALAEHGPDAQIMSGGSDLLINMKFRLDTPKYLVSFNDVAELKAMETLPDGGMQIGAGCTLTQLAGSGELEDKYPALHDAVFSVGSKHVRNAATIGGNICLDTRCWYTNQSEHWRETRDGCFKTDTEECHVIKTAAKCHAINSSDSAPALMVLGATVVLASAKGERELPIVEFYNDDGVDHTVMQPGEFLARVLIPPPTGRSIYAKLAQRDGLDFASGTFAAGIVGSNESPESVCLVMGSVGPAPKVLDKSIEIIMGQGLNDDTIEAAALAARASLGEVTNLFTPSGYKRRLVKALVKDALNELRDKEA